MNKKFLKSVVIIIILILIIPNTSAFFYKNDKNYINNSTTDFPTIIKNINATNPKEENDIRIMSYNLLADCLGFEGTNAFTRANGVCEMLNTISPDVIGLQETSRNWQTAIKDQTDYSFISPIRTEILGTMTAIVYNPATLTLLESGEKVFSKGYDSRLRRIVWGVFRHKNTKKTFIVANTHLSLSNNNITTPVNQATELIDSGNELFEKYNCPIFFTGDFNARERKRNTYISSALYEMLCMTLTDTKTLSKSVSAGTPKSVNASSNDHIFLKGEAQINRYVTLSQNEFINFSDHYPIFIDTTI